MTWVSWRVDTDVVEHIFAGNKSEVIVSEGSHSRGLMRRGRYCTTAILGVFVACPGLTGAGGLDENRSRLWIIEKHNSSIKVLAGGP